MTRYTIELDHDQTDAIVIDSLKDTYRVNSIPDKIDCSDDIIDVDTEFLKAIEVVLGYYMTPEQMKQWRQERTDIKS